MWANALPVHEACRDAAAGGDGGRFYDLPVPERLSARSREAQKESLALRRQQIVALPSQGFEQLDGLMASLEGIDMRPHLKRIKCPTLVVATEEDRVFPLPHARALADGIEGAILEVVTDSGHALIAEQADRLVEVLSGFSAGVRIKGGSST